jgi:hypothetical protein
MENNSQLISSIIEFESSIVYGYTSNEALSFNETSSGSARQTTSLRNNSPKILRRDNVRSQMSKMCYTVDFMFPRYWRKAERNNLIRYVKDYTAHCDCKNSSSNQTNKERCDNINHNVCDWKSVAKMMSKRSEAECYIKFKNQLDPSINHQPWTKDEEKKLSNVIEMHQGHDWAAIADDLGTERTPFQCLEHYQVSNISLIVI